MAGKRILIADDDGLVLSTLGQGLRRNGYEVLEATDGKEAVELALRHLPDLAILDVRMPNMSGLSAGQVIESETGIPLLFLSAYDDTELVEAALDEGAMGYLVKPVSVERIIPSIEAAMRRNADMKKLTRAVQKGKKINRAVGIIMERFKIDEDTAFDRMRRMARSRRTKLEVIASEILDAASLLKLEPVQANAKSRTTRKT